MSDGGGGVALYRSLSTVQHGHKRGRRCFGRFFSVFICFPTEALIAIEKIRGGKQAIITGKYQV
jgi:hypothetical protein